MSGSYRELPSGRHTQICVEMNTFHSLMRETRARVMTKHHSLLSASLRSLYSGEAEVLADLEKGL